MDWYYAHKGERKGPVEIEALKALIADGTLSNNNLVWNQTMGQTWTKIANIPVLAGPPPAADDPVAKEEFRKKMEERNRMIAEQQRSTKMKMITALVVLVILVAGTVIFIKSKPNREWGISSSSPIGTLGKLENRLLTQYKMEKETLAECPEIRKTAAQKFRYTNPKCERGDHVSARGIITVLADAEGRIQAILSTFPSPGAHGYSLTDRSITSIFMNELWEAYGGPEEKAFQERSKVVAGVGNTCGLVEIPEDGVCSVIEKSRMRCIWTEYSPNTVNTMAYFETKQ